MTEKKRRFVDAFMGQAEGNATKAALLAGYSKSTAETQGTRLLADVEICRELDTRRDALKTAAIADAKERREVLTAILRSGNAEPRDRIRAIDVANKMDGVYIEKHEHSGAVQVIASHADERL